MKCKPTMLRSAAEQTTAEKRCHQDFGNCQNKWLSYWWGRSEKVEIEASGEETNKKQANCTTEPWNASGIWCTILLWKEVVQLFGHVQTFVIPWTTASQASLSFTISQSLLKLMSIESVMPSNQLILCQSFPASFPVCQLFTSGGQVLELQL